MKAIEVHSGSPEMLIWTDRPETHPGPGEVSVRWHGSSLNFHDYLVAIGGIPVNPGRVPMSDGAGEVIAVGEGVTEWKTGDRVMSLFFPNWMEGKPDFNKTRYISGETVDGFALEQSCVPAQSLTTIPEGWSFGEAATLPCAALTAWRALFRAACIKPGDSVLIEGTGGMSIFALQFALAAGAQVFATTGSATKTQHLLDLGASAVVNYKEDPNWGKTLFKMTKGGIDHVLDVGGGSTMTQSIEAAAIGGNIIAIGILGNGRKGELTYPKLFFKHLTLHGIAVDHKSAQEDMVRAINQMGIKPVIDSSFPLEDLKKAFNRQESGQHFGKIVVEW